MQEKFYLKLKRKYSLLFYGHDLDLYVSLVNDQNGERPYLSLRKQVFDNESINKVRFKNPINLDMFFKVKIK